MRGEGGSVDNRTVPGVIEGLRAIAEAIDEGRIEAMTVQRASLEGTVDTLRVVSKSSQ